MPTGKALLSFFLLVLPAVSVPAAVSSADRILSGRVLDEAGAGIEDASVFLTPLRPAAGAAAIAPISFTPARAAEAEGTPPLVLRTGPGGAFAATLPPGRYRVAAFKRGYDLTLTEVLVRARGFLELRLRETGARDRDGRTPRDRDLDWILRREGGDVLRDTSAVLPVMESPPEERERSRAGSGAAPTTLAWLGRMAEPIDGRFTHLVGARDPFAEDEATRSSSRSTSLGIEGGIGGQGRWRFDGASGRSALGFGGVDPGRQDRRTERVAAGVEWRLTPQDAVSASLAYGTVRYAAAGVVGGEPDQVQRTAILRSRWDRSLGEAAALYVDGLYLASGLAGTGLIAARDADDADDDRTDSVLRAEAGVRFLRGDHFLDFGMRAGAYRHELRGRGILLQAPFDAPLPIESGETGGVVTLHGRDGWRLTDLTVLDYGLGYHSNPARGQGYLVPRVGMTRGPGGDGGLRFRTFLVARLDDPFASASLPAPSRTGAGAGMAGRRIGGVVAIEGGPPRLARLAASLSYLPFASGLDGGAAPGLAAGDPGGGGPAWAGDEGGIFGEDLVFLTDGLAGRQAVDVELRRTTGPLQGALTGSVGRVGGRVAPAFDESPAHAVTEGGARYVLTRLRALYAPTDTEVRIGWRRVTGEGRAETEADARLDYRRIDVVVAQELPRWSALSARMRLLMAWQDLAWAATDGAVPATAARLSGGVEIEF